MNDERECCPTCGRPLYARHKDRTLSDDDVLFILNNPKDMTAKSLAKKFGLDPSMISKIRNGKQYIDVYSRWLDEEIGSEPSGQ